MIALGERDPPVHAQASFLDFGTGTAGNLTFGTYTPSSFDHRLRHDESEREKADYILRNPERAGLVAQWEQRPHCFMAPDAF